MKPSNERAYGADLAYIHDVGFGRFAQHGAAFVIEHLRAHNVRDGLIVELGCGSGIMSEALCKAGYRVLGCDISQSMVELSRRRVPAVEFRCESFLATEIPPCIAVTAVGEIFNYLFDTRNTQAALRKLFRRVHKALSDGGYLLFDVATVGRVPKGHRRSFINGDDWACLVDAQEDRQRKVLTRRIISFRKQGEHYRRDDEVHRLRLYERSWLTGTLRAEGFRVRTIRRYGALKFPPGYLGIVARKA